MKNYYAKLVGALMMVFLLSNVLYAQEQKLQIKKNQQPEPAKTTVVKKPQTAVKKDATKSKPVDPNYRKVVTKPGLQASPAGQSKQVAVKPTTGSTEPKGNTAQSINKKESKPKKEKITPEQRMAAKKQYYASQAQTIATADTIKPAKKPLKQNPRVKKKLSPGDKIVGGEDYDIEQIPYQVWLGGCGGTIIGAEWVVTAAHCTPAVGDDIYAGMTSINAGASQMRTAAEVYIYEGFSGTSGGKDIALIRVNTPFDFNDPKVQPIPYATPADVANGLTNPCVPALVSGWGDLSQGGNSPDHLQAVIVPIVSNTLTDAAYVGWNGLQAGWITDDQLAAGDYAPQNCSIGNQNGGEDTCQGDSGGPLVVPNAAGNGFILAGVVSWGNGCALPNYPGLYARVSEFADWIEEVTGIVNNQYPNLIISEVVHGDETGGNPKYVEIHNAGTEAYNLDNVAIRVFNDGASTPSATVDLPNVSLAAGATYVVSATAFQASWGGAFATETPDLIHAGITGNGNDVYQLFDTETEGAIDVFGQIGSSNNYWDYEESIAVRNPWIVDANSGGFNQASFDNEWTVENYEGVEATPGTHTAAIPTFDATLVAITGIKQGQNFVGCDGTATISPGVTIYNSGTGSISSLGLEIDFNGTVTTQTITFSPALESGTTRTVGLPALSITTAASFTYEVEIDDANDGNPTNNEGEELTFNTLIFNDATSLTVNVTVDEYAPQENSWVIKDQSGNIIAESSTLAGSGIDIQTACVEDGTYTFTFIDSFGDGIFGGGLTVTLQDGTPIIVIDGEDPIFDNQCNIFFCPDPSERSISIPFTIPYVPTPDLSVELTNPVSSTFALTSCDTEFTPKFKVTNTGNIPVTEFAISYGVGSASETAEYSDILLQPGASLELTLEPITLVAGANTLEVNVTDFNGTGADSNPANDSDEAVITLTIDAEINNIIVSLTTDGYPEENSWEIRDASGNVVASSGGTLYPEDETINIPVCLADGDYTFILLDSYGDGVSADAAVALKTEGGTIFAVISGDFEDEVSAEFELPFTGSTDVSIAITAPSTGASVENCTPLADATITVTNEGNTPVTAITVSYSIDETEESIELTGLLNGGESATINLGKVAVVAGSNTLNVAITDVNGGGVDSNPENDTDASTFNFTVDTESTGLTVSVDLDSYPSETAWEIRDQAGNVVLESSSYAGLGNTTQVEVACLASGCYTFALLDVWGDGGASVTLLVNGVSLAQLGEGEYEELTTTVCVGDVTYPVTGLTATATSATAIELEWEYGFEANSFSIFRSTTGAVGSYASIGTVPSTTLSYTSTGLQPETTYYYSVIAVKDGENSIPVYTSATTGPNLAETELVEGFEGTTFPPAGWIMKDEDGDSFNWFHYTNAAVGSTVAYEGVKCAASASWDGVNEEPLSPDNWLITPQLTIAADYKLYYHIAAQDPDWPEEVYSIMISTTNTDPASFTEVFKETLSSVEWKEQTIDLTAYVGQNIYIAFRHYDVTNVFYMKLDNVIVGIKGEVVEPEGVPSPANFTATATSAYAIDLEWEYEDDVADAFELWTSTTGAVGSFELTEILPADARSYSAAGLAPKTIYYFQLIAKAGEESSIASAASTTTLEAALGVTVLNEGFEGATFPPAGWLLKDEDGDSFNWVSYSLAGVAYEGTKCAASASWNSVAEVPLTPDNWLITPKVSIAADYKLIYQVAAQDPLWTQEVYSIMISTTDTDPASFTEVFNETLSSALWEERTINLSAYAGQDIYIAFRHFDATDIFMMKIDKVQVGIPSLPPPAAITGLVAEALTESSIKLNWADESDNEEGFAVQVAYTANGPWVDYTPTVAANAETVTISSATLIVYGDNYFRVSAFNESGNSAWSTPASATTNINKPTGVTALAESDTEIKVSWTDASAIETGYRVEMATATAGPWTLVVETPANTTSTRVVDLLPVTDYFFRVRSYNANGISDWVSASTATLVTSAEGGSLSHAVTVYPNPTTTRSFAIKLGDRLGSVTNYQVAVFDAKGFNVGSYAATNTHDKDQSFTLTNVNPGLYILKINTGKETIVKKLIVE